MGFEIHQKGVGKVIGGDDTSVKMVWNNIIGKNFKDGKDFTNWMIYLDTVALDQFPYRTDIHLIEDGKIVDEYCMFEFFRRPAIKGLNDLNDIAEFNGTKITGLKPEIYKEVTKDMIPDSYYYMLVDNGDNVGTKLYIKYNRIIGSRLVSYIKLDSIPKEEPKKMVEENVVVIESIDEIIKECTLEGNVIKLPSRQLDSSVYMGVKKMLEKIGGKWNTKAQGFMFDTNPEELFQRLQGGDKINLKQDFQFFETPEDLVSEMVKRANIQPTDEVLEPSAGKGAIVKQLKPLAKRVDMCEFMTANKDYLERVLGYEVLWSDFLDLNTMYKYDKIVANPPFSKNQDIDHTLKMYEHLKDGGKMVVITSTSWVNGSQKKQQAFREFLNEVGAIQTPIEEGTFKASGTKVPTMMLEIQKY